MATAEGAIERKIGTSSRVLEFITEHPRITMGAVGVAAIGAAEWYGLWQLARSVPTPLNVASGNFRITGGRDFGNILPDRVLNIPADLFSLSTLDGSKMGLERNYELGKLELTDRGCQNIVVEKIEGNSFKFTVSNRECITK